jgi:hypothetical protein
MATPVIRASGADTGKEKGRSPEGGAQRLIPEQPSCHAARATASGSTPTPSTDTVPEPGHNRLAILAAEIRAEHEAAAAALKASLQHGLAAGRALIEAKGLLKHGQWLPWLREHCSVSERSAQDFMRLARHAPELEAKSAAGAADLSVRGALELLSPPPPDKPDRDDLDSFDRWFRARFDGPFTELDFPDNHDEVHSRWVKTKLMHQVNVPAIPVWCFGLEVAKDEFPLLRLCPWDDLVEAAKALAPIASGDRALKFDLPDAGAMRRAMAIVQVDATWMLGRVLHEIDYREPLSDERYEREWQETHARVMTRLEEQCGGAP